MSKIKIKTWSWIMLNGTKGEIHEFKKRETRKAIRAGKKKN